MNPFKPDWPEAEERLTALWQRRHLGRPCLAVMAPLDATARRTELWNLLTEEGRPDAEAAPVPAAMGEALPAPPSDMARWLDPDWVAAEALHRISHTWWGGEALPSYLMLAGWVVSLGGQPRFGPDTIWFEPVPEVDFSQPSPFYNWPDDPWIARYQALYLAMARAAGWDRFLLGKPTLLPANDLLSMHMGTQQFLIALMDEPDWMAAPCMAPPFCRGPASSSASAWSWPSGCAPSTASGMETRAGCPSGRQSRMPAPRAMSRACSPPRSSSGSSCPS